MTLNLCQIKNIQSTTSRLVDDRRQEVEAGSSEEGWVHVTSDRCRSEHGCNWELMWTRAADPCLDWKDMTLHLQQRAV